MPWAQEAGQCCGFAVQMPGTSSRKARATAAAVAAAAAAATSGRGAALCLRYGQQAAAITERHQCQARFEQQENRQQRQQSEPRTLQDHDAVSSGGKDQVRDAICTRFVSLLILGVSTHTHTPTHIHPCPRLVWFVGDLCKASLPEFLFCMKIRKPFAALCEFVCLVAFAISEDLHALVAFDAVASSGMLVEYDVWCDLSRCSLQYPPGQFISFEPICILRCSPCTVSFVWLNPPSFLHCCMFFYN